MDYCHDAFTLTAAVLRAICSALPSDQRQVVAEELRIQGERLNESKDESMVRLGGTLSAFAALARGEPDEASAVFRALRPR
ncbi:TPA: hypothetical protein QDB14_004139 [Burkholderia vietnamiensis]|nr:hypothetical protein [Burkholderia vietnamiensis]